VSRESTAQHEARIKALIAERGLHLHTSPGGAVRIHGSGVDLRAASLRHVEVRDLKPDTGPAARL